jgi:hypothetical protein
MKAFSRKHQILGLALGAALVIFLVDLFQGGQGPPSASAASSSAAPAARATSPGGKGAAPAATPAPTPNEVETLLARLNASNGVVRGAVLEGVTRDAFELPAPPKPQPDEYDPNDPNSPRPGSEKPAAHPLPVLEGVVMGTRPVALMNGKLYREGETVGDYRVERIERDRVTLRQGDRELVLRLRAQPGDPRK